MQPNVEPRATCVGLLRNPTYSTQALIALCNAIPLDVKRIKLDKNGLFTDIKVSSNAEHKLRMLWKYIQAFHRFSIEKNGYADVARAMGPCISFVSRSSRANIFHRSLPFGVVNTIVGFLTPVPYERWIDRYAPSRFFLSASTCRDAPSQEEEIAGAVAKKAF